MRFELYCKETHWKPCNFLKKSVQCLIKKQSTISNLGDKMYWTSESNPVFM